jgi:hypothetical protein
MNKRHVLATGIAVLALLVTMATPAQATRWDKPGDGQAEYKFLTYRCDYDDSTGRFEARARARTSVHWVGAGTYYQEVKLQIDKLVLGQQYRMMEQRTYDFSRFQDADTTTYSTSGVRTAVGATIANGGTMRAKVTVLLRKKRLGPDPIVWRYVGSSPQFGCSGIISATP